MSHEHPQIRVEGRRGSLVVYCPGCRRVSLRYGNVLMPLSLERFGEFVHFFEEACARHFNQTREPELKIRFGEFFLCFGDDEVETLLDLVKLAQTEIGRFRLEQAFAITTGA